MARQFSERNARRIAKAVTRIEKAPRNAIARDRYPIPNMKSHCYVYCAGGMTGSSGATLGKGSGMLCSKSGSAMTGSTLNVVTPNVTIYFDNNAAGKSGPFYALLGWADGDWSYVTTPC